MSDHKSEDIEYKDTIESIGSSSDFKVDYDPIMEKKVWRKIDMYVLPIAAMFYLLSFLDRTNIGNARLDGLQTQLKMTNKQYSIALTVTYVPYIATELPSNLILKLIGPNLMLPAMLTLWGLATTLQGVVKTYGGLLACRFFVGLFEGGLLPGIILYLSYFYPRYKMHTRVSGFFSTASLSAAFGGLLAFGIDKMSNVGGREGWAWIFILEGLFTILFGIFAFFTLPRSVETAWFFTPEERSYVQAKIREDNATKDDDVFSWKEVLEAFKLPQTWFQSIIFFCDGTILFGLAYFTPTIVASLGFTNAKAQLMSVPPFAVGFVVAITCSFISDRFRCRGLITIFSSILCIIGFSMFLASKEHHIQYASLFFSITGTYTASPTIIAWNSNNAAPHTRRATVIAWTLVMTNSGGILATWLLGSLSPAPRYTNATITLLVFAICMLLFSVANIVYLRNENKKKEERRKTITREQERPGLGNYSAWFIYNL